MIKHAKQRFKAGSERDPIDIMGYFLLSPREKVLAEPV